MLTVLAANRYLIRQLVARDVRLRYVGSLVGFFWSILNPLVQLALYTVVFGSILGARFDEDPSIGRFALYIFCALLPWMAVQEAVTRSARTFIENSNLIHKVRFPLQVLPETLVISAFIHQCAGTLIFAAVVLFVQGLPAALLLLPLLFLFQLAMMNGICLAMACLNVFFRDIAQVLGVAFMFFFWMTPIVYPRSKAPAVFAWVLNLNPLTHMVEAYRYVFLGHPVPSLAGFIYWAVFCLLALGLGRMVFQRTRRTLVDHI